ncbi:MAG: hypothetical protein LBP59_11085 [Planctomycetaceae bacterium]|jgi:hypothetical protein|nr:hypothetical protein [Planctomycetaceae bacterium]
MNKNELISKLTQNDETAFTEADSKELDALSEDLLKRLCLSTIQQSPASKTVNNVNATNNANKQSATVTNQQQNNNKLRELKESLLAIQSTIQNNLNTEKKLLSELSAFGVTSKSVVNESMIDFDSFVHNSTSPVAQVIREALEVRNHNRQALIDSIVTNSGGLFDVVELENESTEKLQKLAAMATKQSNQITVNENLSSPPLNWQGAGVGDLSIINDANDTEPLLIPSTWE